MIYIEYSNYVGQPVLPGAVPVTRVAEIKYYGPFGDPYAAQGWAQTYLLSDTDHTWRMTEPPRSLVYTPKKLGD